MDKRQPKLRLLHAIFVFVAVVSIGMILGMAAKVWAAPIGKPLTADTKALTGGSYYLNGDIELNDILEVTGASTLDLNGHVLSVKEGGVGIRVKANFTINDSNRTTTHKFKKIEKDAWKWDETTGDVEIHGGVITGAKNKVTGNSYSTAGGAISVVEDNVTVTMNGGNIVGNKLTDEGGRGNAGHGGAAFGMGIECPHGKFIMKGGTIQGNATITSTAAAQGGAIWSFGTVEISGYNTNISYNTADRADTNTKTASGGAIFVQNENSSLSITGSVKLSDNYAKDQGGAILNAGTATLKGTVIENCKSDGSAGAILNLKDLTLDNATKIKNCTAKNFGGAISNTDENAVVTLGAGIAFENCKTTATATEANPGVGGAIFNMGSIINDSDSLLSFKQCSAGYGGGAIYTFKKVTLKEVTFEDCTASVGGAIFNITSTAGENNEPAVVTLNGNTLFKG